MDKEILIFKVPYNQETDRLMFGVKECCDIKEWLDKYLDNK